MENNRERKPYVIYKTFWTARRDTKWDSYATKEEADAALKQLRESPSGQFNYYELRELKT